MKEELFIQHQFPDGMNILIFNKEEEYESSLLIVPANGVPMLFYFPIAEWIAINNNVKIVLMDYLGIGKSKPEHPRFIDRSVVDWARKDVSRVIEFIRSELSISRINYLGHSIGGQMIGLIPEAINLDKIILIASQSAYYKYWKGLSRLKMITNWYLLIPTLVNTFGYLPGRISGMEDLPPKAALEWAKWCRSKEYYLDHQNETFFDEIKCPVVSISFSDDNYAPKASVDWLANKFVNARVDRMHFDPNDLNKKTLSHFGIFKSRNSDLWQLINEELV
ncbi:alpha/beta hydrolase family protein [Marinigracilibium pacificum]|uniref:Alpha/beta fold hydrolase n=1 Tax=Marinigracilibium pacificum TaxID=2729599 RepID=A0A848J6M3_9BACT|nr:alpha/beta fold hydrolase [Marinigracilibium pacificum]NMM48772.1 alpha/beta fold hydrolase [Marinigracilibium pacificum]